MPLSAALKLAEAAGVTLDWVAIGWDRRPDLPPNDIPPEQALDIARILPIADQAEEAFFMSRTALAPIGAPTEALRFLRAPGDSMAPTIQPGAVALVDTSRRSWIGDAIYAFSIGDQVLLRRLSKGVDGAFMLIPDNPHYPTERLTAHEVESLQIDGRVVWAEHRL